MNTVELEEKRIDDRRFSSFAAKMRGAGLPQLAISIFRHYYTQLVAGETGYIYGNDARPINTIPAYEEMDERFVDYGRAAMDRAVVIKLNGGLGTSMGMNMPKSLLPVKDGRSFLDISIQQIMHLRQTYDAQIPLVLMNSFNTHEKTMQALTAYPALVQPVPMAFVQHRIPKILKSDFSPATWPAAPEKEWCPPGHGDLYVAIDSCGMLDQLLDAGFEYAFVSNSDNLGATLDPKILGYLAIHRVPFMMEVARRTAADRKGGHLAQRRDGQLILRELAQCPPDEAEAFQDIDLYRYFNTNNLWINLRTLRQVVDERRGVLGLPLIRNEKPIDPTQPDSPRVYQLETAMGAAISVFPGARALTVPRSRFIPVKKNGDLLALWSDVYHLDENYHLVLADERKGQPPLVVLDETHYGLIEEMKKRFPYGAPKLMECSELRLDGDIHFGRNVTVTGRTHIIHRSSRPYMIADESVIKGA